jgi:hypothetical protein
MGDRRERWRGEKGLRHFGAAVDAVGDLHDEPILRRVARRQNREAVL